MKRAVLPLLIAFLIGSDAALAADRTIPAAKKKLIEQLLELTRAQEGTADAILDILGGRLGIPLPPEEMRGEAREGEEMGKFAEETQAAVYDRYFTQKQLRDLVTFFKSDTGQQYVKVARRVAIESRKNIQAATTKQLKEAAERSRATRTRNDVHSFGVAIETYKTENNHYPNAQNIDELAPILSPKYMASVPMLDAWGRSFQYQISPDGNHYRIVSAGVDGKVESVSGAFAAVSNDKLYGDDIVYLDGRFVHGGDPVYGQ
jgi:Type II secretion system (T2SS), protein G/Uncharacterized protein conserved in bacteria (DUF2059)